METLEVIIGVVVYFLLMSLVASAVAEMISSWRRTRSRLLQDAVRVACGGGKSFCDAVYAHPLVRSLSQQEALIPSGKSTVPEKTKPLPSYIPSESFARAFLETALGLPLEKAGDLGALFIADTPRWNPPHPTNPSTDDASPLAPTPSIPHACWIAAYQTLRPLILAAQGNTAKALELVAKHFENVNERAIGWYKRIVGQHLFWIGLILAIGTNGDATRVVGRLTSDPALRKEMLVLADTLLDQQIQSTNRVDDPREQILNRVRIVESVSGGWSKDPILGQQTETSFFMLGLFKVIGFLITASAVSLGAPFWFDLLRKLLSVRNTLQGGPEPKDSPDKEKDPKEAERKAALKLAAHNAGVDLSHFIPSPAMLAIDHEMAAFSDLAYLGELEFKVRRPELSLPASSLKFISATSPPGDKVHVDTQVYVVRSEKRLVVAFRGTEPTVPADIITDVNFDLVPVPWTPETVRAHAGFLAALEVVWNAVLDAIEALNRETPLPVHFCGHSLGGALAVLAAARYLSGGKRENDGSWVPLAAEQQQQRVNTFGGVHTIGQPRVGNAAFAAWAGKRFAGNYIRAINNRDAVPRLPPPTSNREYKHFGSVHFYDSQGKLWVNPTWFFRLLDFGLPDAEAKNLAKEPVADHSAAEYVRLYAQTTQPALPPAKPLESVVT